MKRDIIQDLVYDRYALNTVTFMDLRKGKAYSKYDIELVEQSKNTVRNDLYSVYSFSVESQSEYNKFYHVDIVIRNTSYAWYLYL